MKNNLLMKSIMLSSVGDWLRNLAPHSQPISDKRKTNPELFANIFPRLAPAACNYLSYLMIGSFDCLSVLGLARDISLVLVNTTLILKQHQGNR